MRNAFFTGTVLLMVASCKDPAAEAPKAEVQAPQAVAPAPTPAARTLVFSQAGSKVEFVGSKVTRSHNGAFAKFQGKLTLSGDDLTLGRVELAIEMAELTSDEEKLTGHLKSPDFFDVAAHPQATFVSTAVAAGQAPGQLNITGNLTLHGVTKSISFPATVNVAGEAAQVQAEFALNRKDFAINYPGMANDLIRDDVLIKLSLQAASEPKQAM